MPAAKTATKPTAKKSAPKKGAEKQETRKKGQNDAMSAKQDLAAKYEHLVRVANSKAKQQKYKVRAAKYRRQVADMERRGV